MKMLLFALALIGATGVAFAEQPRQEAQRQQTQASEIRSDSGEPMGRVVRVIRDEQGRVVGARVAGLEAPADAPPYVMAPARSDQRMMVADASDRRR